jgi:hypothetical protein
VIFFLLWNHRTEPLDHPVLGLASKRQTRVIVDHLWRIVCSSVYACRTYTGCVRVGPDGVVGYVCERRTTRLSSRTRALITLAAFMDVMYQNDLVTCLRSPTRLIGS